MGCGVFDPARESCFSRITGNNMALHLSDFDLIYNHSKIRVNAIHNTVVMYGSYLAMVGNEAKLGSAKPKKAEKVSCWSVNADFGALAVGRRMPFIRFGRGKFTGGCMRLAGT